MAGPFNRRTRKLFGARVHYYHKLLRLLQDGHRLLRILQRKRRFRNVAVYQYGLRAYPYDVHTAHIQPSYLQKDGQRLQPRTFVVYDIHYDEPVGFDIVHSDVSIITTKTAVYRPISRYTAVFMRENQKPPTKKERPKGTLFSLAEK